MKDLAPDEANVHYTLGRLYKQLKDRTNAIKHFTTALHLDPKVRFNPLIQPPDAAITHSDAKFLLPTQANHLIKEAMETLEDADMEEDSEVYRLLEEHS